MFVLVQQDILAQTVKSRLVQAHRVLTAAHVLIKQTVHIHVLVQQDIPGQTAKLLLVMQ